jgi:nucleotide-binding universal stress UspA family protein
MFKKILYPTDFSDVSIKALDYIKELRDVGAEAVTLLHVLDERGLRAIQQYAAEFSRKLRNEMVESAEIELALIEKQLKEAGFRVEKRIEVGNIVREILRIEKEEDISFILIGSHGVSNLEEMFLGSVSEKVIRKCTKPIFVVKRT